jgi:tetratricopeptide (TPR) repeat protein
MPNNEFLKNEYRYPGSHSFDDKSVDRKLFNGREDERNQLLHLILSESLVVLYSKSGIGKTSLLKAGVFKELRQKGFLPVLIRLNEPGREIKEVIFETVEKQAKDNEVIFNPGVKDSLWQYFISTAYILAEKDKRLIPILVFDQFEEIFTLEYTEEQKKRFITQFASLARGIFPEELRQTLSTYDQEYFAENIPEIKIIISIREDFLPLLEELSTDIPTILNVRFRLLPLSPKQAEKAIVEPARLEDKGLLTPKFQYDETALKAIINFLRKKKVGEKTIMSDEIEPFQLQLLCQNVELNILKSKIANNEELLIKEKDLGGEKGMEKILKNFYDDQLRQIPRSKRHAIRKLCEKKLISHTGRRLSIDVDIISKNRRVSKELLDTLIKNRLLRSEPRMGSTYYELSHDTLVKPILDSHKKYRIKRLRRLLFIPPALILLYLLLVLPSINYYLARRYETKGDFVKAANAYKKYIKHHPQINYLYADIGENYFNISQYDSALKYYKIYVSISPYAEYNLKDKGTLLKDEGKFDYAIKFFNEIKNDNKERDSLLNETHKLKQAFETDAKQILEVLNHDPNDIKANYDLGSLCKKYGYYELARGHFRKSIKSDLNTGDLYNEIANTFLKQSSNSNLSQFVFDSAIFYYKKAISIEPENMDYHFNLSYAYFSNGDFEKSIQNSLAAIEIDTTYSELYNLIGKIKYDQGMKPEAFFYFTKAQLRDPKSAAPYNNIGFYYFESDCYDSAKYYLNKSIGFDPNYTTAYWNLKTLADSTKNHVRKYYSEHNYSLAIRQQKEVIEIYESINKSIRNIVENKDIADQYGSLAWYQLFNREFQESIISSEEGLAIDSTETWIYTNLALGYLLSGQIKDAEKIYIEYKSKPYKFNIQYKNFGEAFLDDLNEVEKADIVSDSMRNIAYIRNMLNNK